MNGFALLQKKSTAAFVVVFTWVKRGQINVVFKFHGLKILIRKGKILNISSVLATLKLGKKYKLLLSPILPTLKRASPIFA